MGQPRPQKSTSPLPACFLTIPTLLVILRQQHHPDGSIIIVDEPDSCLLQIHLNQLQRTFLSGRCAIHKHKPLECAALKCWNTAELAKAAAPPRLSRLDILVPDNALVELVRDHETDCSVADLLHHLQAPTPASPTTSAKPQATTPRCETCSRKKPVSPQRTSPFSWAALCPR